MARRDAVVDAHDPAVLVHVGVPPHPCLLVEKVGVHRNHGEFGGGVHHLAVDVGVAIVGDALPFVGQNSGSSSAARNDDRADTHEASPPGCPVGRTFEVGHASPKTCPATTVGLQPKDEVLRLGDEAGRPLTGHLVFRADAIEVLFAAVRIEPTIVIERHDAEVRLALVPKRLKNPVLAEGGAIDQDRAIAVGRRGWRGLWSRSSVHQAGEVLSAGRSGQQQQGGEQEAESPRARRKKFLHGSPR